MKKICVVTGTRAEYGLLKQVMRFIQEDAELKLQIIATGMHLSPEFGLTYKEIEADGFAIDCKVEMLMSSDTPVGIAKSMGLGLISFSEALSALSPDLVLVLGDRFELLSLTSAALVLRIPIAHIHGGESTEGLIDEAIRHSITKMSHLHFVAAEEYRKRVIQLGEHPSKVFMVGGLGADAISQLKLLNRDELEESLKFKMGNKNLLITFHPVTLESSTAELQMNELLLALDSLKDVKLIFTMPNADTDGRKLIKMTDEFVSNHKNACAFTSLGQQRYLSCVSHVDGVIGNSSSGLTEVPSFKKGTINIGDRQAGRIKAESVIECGPTRDEISSSIARLYSSDFQKKLLNVSNPYAAIGASEKIVSIIKVSEFNGLLKKRFYNLN